MEKQKHENQLAEEISQLSSPPPGVEVNADERWAQLESMLDNRGRKKGWIWISVAASLLMVVTAGLFMVNSNDKNITEMAGGWLHEKTQTPLKTPPIPEKKLAFNQLVYQDEYYMDKVEVGYDAGILSGEYLSVDGYIAPPIIYDQYLANEILVLPANVMIAKGKHSKKYKVKNAKTRLPKSLRKEQPRLPRAERRELRKLERLKKRNPDKYAELMRSRNIEVVGVEEYAPLVENEYQQVNLAPLSTFSIDVDAASYAITRRHIQQEHRLPDKNSVRIEELINYFDYEYKKPAGETPFEVNTELSDCPWNKDHQLLSIALQGKSIPKTDIPPSNLVFLLDVSGSMDDPNKLPLVKEAITQLTEQLRPQDKVAIVVYAGAAGLVLPSTGGANKKDILHALNQLQAGGSTAGGEGIELAYQVARENFIDKGNNRIILCTDGDFNVGINSEAGLESLIAEKRQTGIFLSVLGFGMGNYKDSKMEILADKGNGNYAYIDSDKEATRVFVKEFGSTIFAIAKDVKFQIEFNPDFVKAYRLIGYENRLLRDVDFANDKIDAGELGEGHQVTALYEIIPAGSAETVPFQEELRYQSGNKENKSKKEGNGNELLFVKLRYKQPDGETSTLVTYPVVHQPVSLAASSNNFRWAAAVGGFGLLLRHSQFSGDLNYEKVLALAQGALGENPDEFRTEFIEMVKEAAQLSGVTTGK